MTRAFDMLASLLGLIVSSPVLAVIACIVKSDSPGPVFFSQARVGLHEKSFNIYKFRTMRESSVGAAVTSDGDPRITLSGRWLRSMKLDELPQLINVLKGDMSLVGPRPEVAKYVEHWPTDARAKILSVRPGITDPASIEFRREAEILAAASDPEQHYIDVILPLKVAHYVKYAEQRTFLGDLRIILKTLSSVAKD